MSEKNKIEVGDLWKIEDEPKVYYVVKLIRDHPGVTNNSKKTVVDVVEYSNPPGLFTRTVDKTYIDLILDRKITDPKEKAFILLQMENVHEIT